jgi:hypothetical protein
VWLYTHSLRDRLRSSRTRRHSHHRPRRSHPRRASPMSMRNAASAAVGARLASRIEPTGGAPTRGRLLVAAGRLRPRWPSGWRRSARPGRRPS